MFRPTPTSALIFTVMATIPTNPVPSEDTKPCCQAVNLTYSCGHMDTKYLKFTISGVRVRVADLDASTVPCPESTFATDSTGSKTPMPHTRTALRLTYKNSYVSNAEGDFSNRRAARSTTSSTNSSSDDNKPVPEPFTTDHSHPLCGLFQVTTASATRMCPGCLRRSDHRPTTSELEELRSTLRTARRGKWSQSTVDHLTQRLRSAEQDEWTIGALTEAFHPWTEFEDELQELGWI